MNKTITVFTPTYNRSHLLRRLYESLKNQTNKDFKWMIIDDGSQDGTANIVMKWIKENYLPIEYQYKNNGGMHTAHNLAYQLINTELNVCIDSDDLMPANAIDKILKIWEEKNPQETAGIIGLNADLEGNVLGSSSPGGLTFTTVSELYKKHKIVGDRKLVYRTDIMQEIEPYPEFDGEKLVPLAYKYLLADLHYKMILSDEILCYVDYQQQGSTNTIMNQYFESPKGFAAARKLRMKHSPYLTDRFRNAIHYVSSSIILRNKHFLSESPRKLLTLIAIPFGILLTAYLVSMVKPWQSDKKEKTEAHVNNIL